MIPKPHILTSPMDTKLSIGPCRHQNMLGNLDPPFCVLSGAPTLWEPAGDESDGEEEDSDGPAPSAGEGRG